METVAVVLIIGLMALILLPRMTGYSSGNLRSVSRHLIGTIQSVRDEAESRQEILVLAVNLKEQSYEVTRMRENGEIVPFEGTGVGKVRLPARVKIRDVVTTRQGKVTEGTAFIHFFPAGRVEKSEFHLEEGGRVLTLSLSTLSGKVKLDEGYIEER